MHLAREACDCFDHVRREVELLQHDAIFEPRDLFNLIAVQMELLEKSTAMQNMRLKEDLSTTNLLGQVLDLSDAVLAEVQVS